MTDMHQATTHSFMTKGSVTQFKYVLGLYSDAMKLKAESKSLRKPQELIKLDDWYQKELPLLIKKRGKDPHIIHDELVGIIKWKLARGKFRPRLKELVTMNSPRVVAQESRKALRALFKKNDLGTAVNYLCNLKGINPATASAILTAAAPHLAAFMADECIAAVPEIEGIDYTTKEYLEMLKHIKQAAERLHNGIPESPDNLNLHEIELTLWTHHVILQFKPDLLLDLPPNDDLKSKSNLTSSFTNGPNAHLEGDDETNNSTASNDGPVTSSTINPPLGHFEEDSLGSTISTEGQQSNDSNSYSGNGNHLDQIENENHNQGGQEEHEVVNNKHLNNNDDSSSDSAAAMSMISNNEHLEDQHANLVEPIVNSSNLVVAATNGNCNPAVEVENHNNHENNHNDFIEIGQPQPPTQLQQIQPVQIEEQHLDEIVVGNCGGVVGVALGLGISLDGIVDEIAEEAIDGEPERKKARAF